MINGKRILGIIPARGGSKGIPRKNIKVLAGKPLIAWTIEEAKKSKYIDRCIVSTDDDEIMAVAKNWGGDVPFKRPAALAQDDSPGIAPVLHAIEQIPEYDYIVLLQPTSPLRTVDDIDGCIEYCFHRLGESCVSVTEAETSPYWMVTLDERNMLSPLIKVANEKMYQRQKLPKVYQYNGAVYIASSSFLQCNKVFVKEETLGYVMPKNRSYDIDTVLDFWLIESILCDTDNKI